MNQIWVYLSATPLLGLTLTLIVYFVARHLYEWSGHKSFTHPIILSVALIWLVLAVTGTSYATYFQGAQFVHFLLGPATVALAMPLYDQRMTLRRNWLPITLGVLAGSVTAVVSSVLIGWSLGASRESVLSLVPKSVTTPIAMGITEKLGGLPSLTAAFVFLTGVISVVLAKPLFDLLRIRSDEARGFAMGLGAHGLGTARALGVNERMGAFAALALGLTALTTAVVAPFAVPPLLAWLGLG
ncbi:LrgB family protein [soil metagenome]